ncbi:hypothetical protein [Absidia glauca]|uniref:Uncharacterized protein n=1 Tax=Absidia glauca TaxID=4829 RepID=A0A168SEK8_ABSGL|nr:hypothetical protein [Absidia glauca]
MPDVTREMYTNDDKDQVHELGPNVRLDMSNHGPDSDLHQSILQQDESSTDPEELALAQEEAGLRIVQELKNPDSEWQQVQAYGYLSDSARKHSLTATTLRRPGSIHRCPLKFFNKEKTECIIIAHLGLNM